jgi:hypothetical protein
MGQCVSVLIKATMELNELGMDHNDPNKTLSKNYSTLPIWECMMPPLAS